MTTPTDPLAGISMPYGGTLVPQEGADILQITAEHRNRQGAGASTIFEVPDGVSLVTASWDGPQGATVTLRDNGSGARKDLARIEAGGGVRSTPPVTVATVGTGNGIQVFLDSPPPADQADRRGSVTVVPISPPAS